MVRTKVFVGNLSFATKENELAKEFEASGKVISANIITRGPRSLGYGFVEMDNEADAENAVKLLDKKEIDGRPINVEVAKPREEGAEGQQQQGQQGEGSRGGRGGFRGSRGGNGRGRGRGGFRGGDRNGENDGRRNFRRREDDGEEGQGQQQQDQSDRGGRGRGRGRGSRGRGRGGNGIPRPRRDSATKREDNRAPSATTLFVANLPFTLDDEAFAKIFKDGGLAYKSAHVVKKRSGRSKGFGFVEFENESDQQKALNGINNKSVEGRELVVKVALTENKTEEGNASNNGKEENKTADAKVSTPKTDAKSSPKPETK